eukprot:TRINITY_DN9986_c0_g2_i4.p1 TRINITY_DN9986_c0_g2~~TRINITY_DN9986_c0_g2_i4.p1  ORF type:complete len:327 (+),score=13.51 TRINITY_DN9986_c0_g2_i4:217-1197(+)
MKKLIEKQRRIIERLTSKFSDLRKKHRSEENSSSLVGDSRPRVGRDCGLVDENSKPTNDQIDELSLALRILEENSCFKDLTEEEIVREASLKAVERAPVDRMDKDEEEKAMSGEQLFEDFSIFNAEISLLNRRTMNNITGTALTMRDISNNSNRQLSKDNSPPNFSQTIQRRSRENSSESCPFNTKVSSNLEPFPIVTNFSQIFKKSSVQPNNITFSESNNFPFSGKMVALKRAPTEEIETSRERQGKRVPPKSNVAQPKSSQTRVLKQLTLDFGHLKNSGSQIQFRPKIRLRQFYFMLCVPLIVSEIGRLKMRDGDFGVQSFLES